MKTWCLGFVTALLFTALPLAAEPVKTPAPVGQIPHEAEYKQIVISYVRSNRGWFDSNYTVTYSGKDGDRLIFLVDYKLGDTSSNLVTSDFTSFKVELNPTTKRVEKEIFF